MSKEKRVKELVCDGVTEMDEGSKEFAEALLGKGLFPRNLVNEGAPVKVKVTIEGEPGQDPDKAELEVSGTLTFEKGVEDVCDWYQSIIQDLPDGPVYVASEGTSVSDEGDDILVSSRPVSPSEWR